MYMPQIMQPRMRKKLTRTTLAHGHVMRLIRSPISDDTVYGCTGPPHPPGRTDTRAEAGRARQLESVYRKIVQAAHCCS